MPASMQDVTMEDLMTTYSTFYTNFVNWYSQFFGQHGVLSVKSVQIMDGAEELTVFNINVPTQVPNTFVTDTSLGGIAA
jgi:hypothetical protein